MSEYRVAELANAAGSTVRNVRVYQDRGLLPPPRREGRIGLYSEEHLARLRLIGRLLDRGYTFATIGELFDAQARGHDLADMLGLREVIGAPWTDETPVRMTRRDLRRRFGRNVTPETIERAVEIGLIVRSGAAYLVPSPRLLDAGAELVGAGVPLTAVLDLAEALRDDMTKVARRFYAVMTTAVASIGEGENSAAELMNAVTRLRPHAQRTIDALLAMAMQDEAERLLGESEARTGGQLRDASPAS